MTKAELEQYRSIVAEIDEIRDRLNKNTVHGTVTGSDSEFPYVKHSITVGGVEQSDNSSRDMLLIQRLERQKREIECFIHNIPDSITRRIFTYRYIDGKVKPSWQWIAFKMGVSGDGSTERKKVDRYLKISRNS
ncbi:MAG: hypothetical protein HFE51_10505 [Clostridia bacterium]|nr:hypothetical protein [Clostridia bacterium]MCI9086826.1 hypothetical protein [Clostridia bacterium]